MEDAPLTTGGWKPVFDPTTPNSTTVIGYHWDGAFDYLADDSTRLQTVEIWIPASPANLSYGKPTPGECAFGGHNGAPYLVYIHGGAWRDPAIDSSSFNASAIKILSSLSCQPFEQRKQKLAGIASINYRLSPYPSHPTDPSDPTDPDRNARHPDHIADVLTALGFLQKRFGVKEYILAGHSCGATLALQACMDDKRWDIYGGIRDGWGGVFNVTKPRTVVGFNGLYDLAGFVENPPRGYERLREAYREFVTDAFGKDEKGWKEACPGSAESWTKEWKVSYGEGKRKVVLVQSLEDSLVPVEQTEGMARYLERENEKVGDEKEKIDVVVLREEKGGDHNEVWQKGDKLAETLVKILKGEI